MVSPINLPPQGPRLAGTREVSRHPPPRPRGKPRPLTLRQRSPGGPLRDTIPSLNPRVQRAGCVSGQYHKAVNASCVCGCRVSWRHPFRHPGETYSLGRTGVSRRPELRVYPILGCDIFIFAGSPPLDAGRLRLALSTLRPPWTSTGKPRGRAPLWAPRRTSTTISCQSSCQPSGRPPRSSMKSMGGTLGPP